MFYIALQLLFCVGDFFGDDNDNTEWEQLVAGTMKGINITSQL